MWFLIQSSTIFAVCAANIYWQITPNGYVAAALGAGLAYILTDAVNDLSGKLLARREKRRAQSRERNIDLRGRQ